MCIGSPIIKLVDVLFAASSASRFLCSLKVTMGMLEGCSLCKLPLKQPLVLPSLDPLKTPVTQGFVGKEEWGVRVIMIALMCCGPSTAVKCLRHWAFEDTE